VIVLEWGIDESWQQGESVSDQQSVELHKKGHALASRVTAKGWLLSSPRARTGTSQDIEVALSAWIDENGRHWAGTLTAVQGSSTASTN
jgi:hypothetical protein